MKSVNWGSSGQKVPAIAMGCMRMSRVPFEQVTELVDTAKMRNRAGQNV